MTAQPCCNFSGRSCDWPVAVSRQKKVVYSRAAAGTTSGGRMNKQFRRISGSVVAPQGFLAAGVFCDIKRLGTGKGSNKGRKHDLALIISEVPATVAGMFTTNQICAAPVKVCIQRVKKRVAQAIVVNSGNANVCTGKQGMKDALEMAGFT